MRAHMVTQTTRLVLGMSAMIALLFLVFAASAARAGEAKAVSNQVPYKNQTQKKASAAPMAKGGGSQKNANLSRDVVFDGTAVNGRYHTAGEAVATVEQEKSLNNLIGWRKNFKDRLTAERDRLAVETANEATKTEGQ